MWSIGEKCWGCCGESFVPGCRKAKESPAERFWTGDRKVLQGGIENFYSLAACCCTEVLQKSVAEECREEWLWKNNRRPPEYGVQRQLNVHNIFQRFIYFPVETLWWDKKS